LETAVVSLKNACLGYAGKPPKVLANQLNFAWKKGVCCGIIGQNGAGKSTLLRSITGLQPLLAGDLFWEQQEVQTLSPDLRAMKMSVVLTEKIPPSLLTVFELVALGRYPHTDWMGQLTDFDREKIIGALTQTETLHLSERLFDTLSDGQKQQVLIARALAQDTPVMVLDEPTTHLDLPHKLLVLKLLQKIAKEHQKTVIFSTHDVEWALTYCDELVVITPEKWQHDSTENCINNNLLNGLFTDSNVHFDRETKRFVIA